MNGWIGLHETPEESCVLGAFKCICWLESHAHFESKKLSKNYFDFSPFNMSSPCQRLTSLFENLLLTKCLSHLGKKYFKKAQKLSFSQAFSANRSISSFFYEQISNISHSHQFTGFRMAHEEIAYGQSRFIEILQVHTNHSAWDDKPGHGG